MFSSNFQTTSFSSKGQEASPSLQKTHPHVVLDLFPLTFIFFIFLAKVKLQIKKANHQKNKYQQHFGHYGQHPFESATNSTGRKETP